MKLKKVLGLLFLVIMSLSTYAMAEEPTVEWAKYYSGTYLSENSTRDMAIDASGNSYIIGLDHSEGFVTIKYDTNGNEKWVKKYISSGRPNAIAVDTSGNVYVVGGSGNYQNSNFITIKYDSDGNELWVRTHSGDWAFQFIAVDSSGNVYITGGNGGSILTIKYDTNGNELWARTYSNGSSESYGIAVDLQGNVYVTGDSGYIITTIKYDTNGNELWVKRYTEHSGGGYSAVKVDSSDNVYVGGSTSGGNVVIKYDKDGNELWARLYPGGFNAGPNCLAVDSSGNAVITGMGFISGGYDYVTQKYDTNGNLLWVKRSPGYNTAYPVVATDSFGSVYVTGAPLMVVKFQANGETAWVNSYDLGAYNSGAAADIKVDSSGNVYVAGTSVNYWSWATKWFTIKYKQCLITADAGPDQTVVQTSPDGANVVLDGSASVGTDLVYNWTWQGGSATGPNPTVFLPAGVTEVTLEVSNGTCRATDTVSITVHDGTPPITTSIVTGINGNNGWYISDVTVTLTATDSESGVARTEYSTNGTEWFTYTAPFVVGSEGITTIYYRSTDNAGNPEAAKSIEIKIDKTSPTIIANVNHPTNANGWHNGDVVVIFTCNDPVPGSGVASCPSPITVSTEGEGQVIAGTVHDLAGNSATASVTLNIDKTAPAVNINSPFDGAEYTLGQAVTADWSVNDVLSGNDGVTATLPVGSVVDTSISGAKTFSVTATDRAGNTVTRTSTYYVRFTYGGISQPINADGSSVFRLGSTVAVKFQLTDAGGNFITSAVARIYVAKITDNVIGTEEEAVSTSAASTGNIFRYDGTANQYIFNLSTENMSAGTWQIRIELSDGSSKAAVFSVR